MTFLIFTVRGAASTVFAAIFFQQWRSFIICFRMSRQQSFRCFLGEGNVQLFRGMRILFGEGNMLLVLDGRINFQLDFFFP